MIERFQSREVATVPSVREPGVLYFCPRYATAVHSCACGCGGKVVTPIGRSRWTLGGGPSDPSLFPSVANNGLRCRSHYYIDSGRVVWANPHTDAQATRTADRDRADRGHYYASRTFRGRVLALWANIRLLGRRE